MKRSFIALSLACLLAGCATTGNETVICKGSGGGGTEELHLCKPEQSIADNVWYGMGMSMLHCFETR